MEGCCSCFCRRIYLTGLESDDNTDPLTCSRFLSAAELHESGCLLHDKGLQSLGELKQLKVIAGPPVWFNKVVSVCPQLVHQEPVRVWAFVNFPARVVQCAPGRSKLRSYSQQTWLCSRVAAPKTSDDCTNVPPRCSLLQRVNEVSLQMGHQLGYTQERKHQGCTSLQFPDKAAP